MKSKILSSSFAVINTLNAKKVDCDGLQRVRPRPRFMCGSPNSSPPECDCIWRQGLYKGNYVKMRSLGEPEPNVTGVSAEVIRKKDHVETQEGEAMRGLRRSQPCLQLADGLFSRADFAALKYASLACWGNKLSETTHPGQAPE